MAKGTRSLGITARLLIVALVPAVLLFALVTGSLVVSVRNDVRNDVVRRGEWLARALAESVRYGLAAGSRQDVRNAIDRVRGGPGIVSIEVYDHQHELVARVSTLSQEFSEEQASEVPVYANLMGWTEIDPLDHREPVADRARAPGRDVPSTVIGYVRVGASSIPVLREKQSTILAAAGFVLAATLLSILVGVYLASRLRIALDHILQSLRSIKQGRYATELRVTDAGEIGEIQAGVIALAKSLAAWQGDMEARVAERTSALNTALEKLGDADGERQRLIARSNALIEEERASIATDLHDQLNAEVVVMKMEAGRVRSLAQRVGDADTAKKISDSATRIQEVCGHLYDKARAITRRLRPELLDALGLEGAVRDLVHSLAHSGIDYVVRAEPLPAFSGAAPIVAYRIVQEALSNVHKHARASAVRIELQWIAERGCLALSIHDNGCGFDPASVGNSGLGLVGMRERARACDGHIEIRSAPGAGTKILVELRAMDS